jgi:hypothetical protein
MAENGRCWNQGFVQDFFKGVLERMPLQMSNPMQDLAQPRGELPTALSEPTPPTNDKDDSNVYTIYLQVSTSL